MVMLKVISLGAGVQSTVLTLQAFNGDYGAPPDAVIFADTLWESEATYEHLAWLETQLPIPVTRVGIGRSLRDDTLMQTAHGTADNRVDIPVYLAGPRGTGMGWRQCTTNYKLTPIRQEVRRLLGLTSRQRAKPDSAEMWLGISVDEAHRMSDSKVKWLRNRYPLVEVRLSRANCAAWFEQHYPGRLLPPSACLGCPFQSRHRWVTTKHSYPAAYQDLVHIDAELRNGKLKLDGAYLHPSRKPLEEAVATDAQQSSMFDDAFGNECEGLCGN